ncbi:MAG: penicillin-binding protein 2, partial [Gammaproteobacteria bacterium]|nr:penicillin-binding protein 2 [Gammaproteobacteria bacterium]
KTLPERLRDHAWFIAFAPAEAPRIAIAVLAENAGFGSQSAAPIARKVMDAYLLDADGKLKAAPPGSLLPPRASKPAPNTKTAADQPAIQQLPDDPVMSAQAAEAPAPTPQAVD